MSEQFRGTGRRKTSVARVRVLSNGSGQFIVNKKAIDEYFENGRLKLGKSPESTKSIHLEIIKGSCPLQNIRLANSLKMRGYDFYFSFGNAQHNTTHGDAELPQALTWIWRDYDQSKTQQEFTMDPLEVNRPYFRVEITNR